MKFRTGELVVFQTQHKKELGLVKRTADENNSFVWYHMGGTCAQTPNVLIRQISMNEVLLTTFDNEYAKASLLERQLCLIDNRCDVDDLIDDRNIRQSVIETIRNTRNYRRL